MMKMCFGDGTEGRKKMVIDGLGTDITCLLGLAKFVLHVAAQSPRWLTVE